MKHYCGIYAQNSEGECDWKTKTQYYDDTHNGDYPEYFPRDCGSAIVYCQEYSNGVLYVTNEEYSSQVNFCPFCGYEARVKIGSK